MEQDIIKLLQELLWIIVPLILIELTLMVIALRDWYKKREYLDQNKLIWLLIILFFNFFGPIIYLWYSHNKIMKIDDTEDEWSS